MRPVIMILSVLVVAHLTNQALAASAFAHHPADAPKSNVEQIADGSHVYTILQGGTMDGTNCRSPVSVGMADGPAITQTWESNRSVRLENVGQTDAIPARLRR